MTDILQNVFDETISLVLKEDQKFLTEFFDQNRKYFKTVSPKKEYGSTDPDSVQFQLSIISPDCLIHDKETFYRWICLDFYLLPLKKNDCWHLAEKQGSYSPECQKGIVYLNSNDGAVYYQTPLKESFCVASSCLEFLHRIGEECEFYPCSPFNEDTAAHELPEESKTLIRRCFSRENNEDLILFYTFLDILDREGEYLISNSRESLVDRWTYDLDVLIELPPRRLKNCYRFPKGSGDWYRIGMLCPHNDYEDKHVSKMELLFDRTTGEYAVSYLYTNNQEPFWPYFDLRKMLFPMTLAEQRLAVLRLGSFAGFLKRRNNYSGSSPEQTDENIIANEKNELSALEHSLLNKKSILHFFKSSFLLCFLLYYLFQGITLFYYSFQGITRAAGSDSRTSFLVFGSFGLACFCSLLFYLRCPRIIRVEVSPPVRPPQQCPDSIKDFPS